MALPKIGFNEGSLLRRTLLHVGTFVIGSIAFIGLVSLVLVTIASRLVAPPSASAEPGAGDDEPAVPGAVAPGATTDKPSTKPATRPPRASKRRPTPVKPTTEKPSDE